MAADGHPLRDLRRCIIDAVDPIGVARRQFRDWCKRQDAPGWPLRFHLFTRWER